MTYSEFTSLVGFAQSPIVLLEGRRSISSADFRRARETAIHLAKEFPMLQFRSGNADGSDQAFADGIASVDPSRLQVVAPYEGHRKRHRTPGATYDSPESLNRAQEERILEDTIKASPRNKRLIERRTAGGALGAKAQYLIRDTMKVAGHSDHFPTPVAALFHVDLANPETGGTGHTIRVCRQHGVPCAFQDAWGSWFE